MEREAADTAIGLEDVAKVYAIGTTRLRALDGVTLRMRQGEFCLVTGRSGSGKSTLLNMMAGLERPTRGRIRVAGKQIERLSEAQLVQFRLNNVGFVFQSFNLFAMHTALDNVAMPMMYKGVDRAARLRRARKMLHAVGLSSHLMHRPGQMSGGQQQRVGIARALVTNPKILFADEPTGNLDFRTSREILRLIREICRERGTTLVMVTHDADMARYCDHVIQLLDGRVIRDERNEQPADIPLAAVHGPAASPAQAQDAPAAPPAPTGQAPTARDI